MHCLAEFKAIKGTQASNWASNNHYQHLPSTRPQKTCRIDTNGRVRGCRCCLHISRIFADLKSHVVKDAWNKLDAVMIGLYIPMMVLRLYLNAICEQDATDVSGEDGECRVSRQGWGPYTDPTIWFSVLLALIVLTSWLRAFALLIMSKTTGVLIIAMFQMINNVLVSYSFLDLSMQPVQITMIKPFFCFALFRFSRVHGRSTL